MDEEQPPPRDGTRREQPAQPSAADRVDPSVGDASRLITIPLSAIGAVVVHIRAALGGLRARWARIAPRRQLLLVLTIAVLVAVLASTGLIVLAFPAQLGLTPLALSSTGPVGGRAQARAHASPTAPIADQTATPWPTTQVVHSPQGCVDGVAPAPGQGPLGPIYTTHGYAGVGNEIALTFDDGPNPNFTPQILATLKAADVHATFFVVGRHATLHPELVQQEWEDGNAIGNHTFDHEWIPGLSREKLQTSLDSTAKIIRAATGDSCVWLFRPPYGDLIPPARVAPTPPEGGAPPPVEQVPVTVTRAWQVLHGSGYTPVNWDTSGHDWLRPGAEVIAHQIIAQLHPGAIILMHDGAPDTEKQDRSQTVAALPAVLDAIRARGLVPVTLPQLLYDAGLITRPIPPTPTPRPHGPPTGSTGGPTGAILLLAAPAALGETKRRRGRRRACNGVRDALWRSVDNQSWPSCGPPGRRGAARTGRGSRSP